MKIANIKIKNVLGIEELNLAPQNITTISAKNGLGKSSVIEAIKSALGGGHDATLLRQGAESGEVVIDFTEGYQVKMTTNGEKTTREVRRDGAKLASPVSVLNSLRDMVSVNPIEFLSATPQHQVELLLGAVNVELDVKQLAETLDRPIVSESHPLKTLDRLRRELYVERTNENRTAKDKETTANQLAESIVEDDVDYTQAIDECTSAFQAKSDERRAKFQELANKERAAREVVASEREAELDAVRKKYDVMLANAVDAIQAEKDAINAAESEERAAHQAEIERLRGLERTQIENARTRKIVEDARRASELALTRSEALTARITYLDEMKRGWLASTPFKGLDVTDEGITLDGIPFDRVNTARRMEFAVELAKARSGQVKLVCLDGVDELDSESRAQLIETAKESDCQFFITRVSDDAHLQIETV